MLCCDEFSRFLELISKSENTIEVAGEALDQIAGVLGIGRVVVRFVNLPNRFAPKGTDVCSSIYNKIGGVFQEPGYEKAYTTGEGGTVTFSVYPAEEVLLWSDEQVKDIETVLDLLFVHLGRHHLITRMQTMAMTHYLTGLPNSGGFMMQVRRLFEQKTLKRYNAFYFNLKGFGLVNRRFGQREGDEIMKRYAAFLQEFLLPDEFLSHFGGDNFAALIRKDHTEEFLSILGGTVIYGSIEGRRVPVRIEAVAGVMEIDDTLAAPGQVIDNCAVALQVAKNQANKPFVFVSPELKERVFKEKKIHAHFRDALRNQEFQVYYQPKVDTKSYVMTGAEALVRWIWDGQMVSPADFIPLIERDGTVTDLDLYMLEKACQDIRGWLDRGLNPVPISVNFSRRDISDPLLAQKILNIIDDSGIDRKYIQVEVTETTSEEEAARLIQFLNTMKMMHVETAIDDFGSGYSSLNTLRNFNVNVIKIDRSFIANDSITAKDEIVLHNIVDMAKELNIDVITEGVEVWDQVKLLHKVGCYMIQGFLFDRPMPKAEFEQRLSKRSYEHDAALEA